MVPDVLHRVPRALAGASFLAPLVALLTLAIGEEIYRCDILRVSNCD